MKISTRSYNNQTVRAVWDEKSMQWLFAVVDIISILVPGSAPLNYWDSLRSQLKRLKPGLATACRRIKMEDSNGKQSLTDCLGQQDILSFAGFIPGQKTEDFILWLIKSVDSIDGKSRTRAYALFESELISTMEPGTVRCLQQIHEFLFEGLYDFAGKIRTINISKGGFPFAVAAFLNESLKKVEVMPENTYDEIIAKYIEMNVAHPFLEGNGRSTRIWLDLMLRRTLQQCVDWSKVDKNDYLAAMRESVSDGAHLKELLRGALTDRIDDREVFMKGIDYSYYYESDDPAMEPDDIAGQVEPDGAEPDTTEFPSRTYTEANYKNAVVKLLEQLGYSQVYGVDDKRDYGDPLLPDVLNDSLHAINPGVPEAAIEEAIRKLRHIENGSLVERNIIFTDYLQNGIDVSYHLDGEEKADHVRLIDTEHAERNSFIVADEWTIIGHAEKRADIVLFINGMPLVIMELKSPVREGTGISAAYRQIQNYMKEIPEFFVYNAFCIISDLSETRAGTITANEDRFMEWKTVDGINESMAQVDFQTPFRGMLEPRRLLDLLENFICYSREEKGPKKILACYHQYFAVRKALVSTRNAANEGGDGRGGVFWHTQGSGKSLSMVFYTKLLQRELKSQTVVVITDRNDLDDQLYGQFVKCQEFLRQTPDQAGSRENWDGGDGSGNFSSREKLRGLLKDREANGIIFTTMQNFVEPGDGKPLSDRRNIVVIADEAHRGHYGFETMRRDGTIHKGIAQIIRDNLPNATFIGFTGTPVSSRDHNTREVFGDYIDVYDMTQAVADGATRPVYYESRVIHLRLDQELLRRIDEEYDRMELETDSYVIEKSKNELSRMESLLGAPETIGALCEDIVKHYEETRAQELTGKAMIVAYSRPIAMSIYRKILELRPGWREKVAVVMTGSNNDPKEWAEIVGNKTRRKELAAKFKDNDSPLKIAIVVDMWLTGFDMPSLATMYVYKPMAGHNLMQAIARVNRVFRDKEGGLVVDYVGIARALKLAMNDYTVRDRKNYGEMDVSRAALPKFQEKLEVCRALLHGFDYAGFIDGDDLARSELIAGGANYLFEPARAKTKDSFIREVLALRQALSLCRSIVPQSERFEAAYLEAVRTMLTRVTGKTGRFSLKTINERINELLQESVRSEGVINLFADVKQKFSLFDPEFLKQVAAMKQKNIAVEILRRLIADQIAVYRRTNVVKSELFSEKFQRIMNLYLNGQLTNEEVIQELTDLAFELRRDSEEGKELGLSQEEVAFYDALTKPQAVKDFYDNETLVALTRELTDLLRKNKTIDWRQKQTARAKMRMMVKRLLKKYKYPPDDQAEALETVISQCEMWTDNADLAADADEGENDGVE